MIVKNDEFNQKLRLLSLAVSKSATALPITKLVLFKAVEGIVYGYTIDGINNVRVEIGPCQDDFFAVVNYDILAKFIKSCEGDITLETTDKFLQIKASNTKCKLPLQILERKHTVNMDSIIIDDTKYTNDLDTNFDLKVLNAVLDPNHVVSVYKNVCFNDTIMVTDTDNVIIIKKNLFNDQVLLHPSAVEILTSVTNAKYYIDNFATNNSNTQHRILRIKSDELYATIVIRDQEDFQYSDLYALFTDVDGPNIELDTKSLSKAIGTSMLFNGTKIIEFCDKGIFIKIPNSDFVYKVADTVCDARKFEINADVCKKICAVGDTVTLYYNNQDLIKCESEDIAGVFGIKEVDSNE